MHHSLRFYSRYREWFLRYYVWQSSWTRMPLVGRVVKEVANFYGSHGSTAYLLTLSQAEEIVDISEGLALGPCDCRSVFRNCDNPLHAELMLGLRRNIFIVERAHDYREITPQAAKDVLKRCQERGLIHTLVRCRQDFYAICNCCACCCVPLRLSKQYGIGKALVRDSDIVRRFKQRQLEIT